MRSNQKDKDQSVEFRETQSKAVHNDNQNDPHQDIKPEVFKYFFTGIHDILNYNKSYATVYCYFNSYSWYFFIFL